MLTILTVAATMAAAQAAANVVDEPIWQMPGGEIMFRDYPVQAQGKSGKVAFRFRRQRRAQRLP